MTMARTFFLVAVASLSFVAMPMAAQADLYACASCSYDTGCGKFTDSAHHCADKDDVGVKFFRKSCDQVGGDVWAVEGLTMDQVDKEFGHKPLKVCLGDWTEADGDK